MCIGWLLFMIMFSKAYGLSLLCPFGCDCMAMLDAVGDFGDPWECRLSMGRASREHA